MRSDLEKAFNASKPLKNWRLPMPSLEEMEAMLSSGEEVIQVVRASINLQHVGVAILTQNSMHLLGRGTLKTLSNYNESFSLAHLTGVSRTKQIKYLGWTIEVSRASNVDKLVGVNAEDSESFVKNCKELSDSLATGNRGSAISRDTNEDVFAQLEKLTALFDKGILSKDEFEAKKQELLRRI